MGEELYKNIAGRSHSANPVEELGSQGAVLAGGISVEPDIAHIAGREAGNVQLLPTNRDSFSQLWGRNVSLGVTRQAVGWKVSGIVLKGEWIENSLEPRG